MQHGHRSCKTTFPFLKTRAVTRGPKTGLGLIFQALPSLPCFYHTSPEGGTVQPPVKTSTQSHESAAPILKVSEVQEDKALGKVRSRRCPPPTPTRPYPGHLVLITSKQVHEVQGTSSGPLWHYFNKGPHQLRALVLPPLRIGQHTKVHTGNGRPPQCSLPITLVTAMRQNPLSTNVPGVDSLGSLNQAAATGHGSDFEFPALSHLVSYGF